MMNWRNFLKNSHGNIAMMTALLAVPLFAVAGGAVDFAGRNSLEASLQKAVDAATLAGAASESDHESHIRKVIDRTLKANTSRLAGNISPADLSIDVSISVDGVIRVSAQTEYRTTLSRVIGIETLPATASAEARMNQASAEIALVLDTTGSMAGSNLSALQAAATQFVDIAFAPNNLRADAVKAAIVPYAEYVNVGISNRNAGWLEMPAGPEGTPPPAWAGCVGSREAPWNTADGNLGYRIPALAADLTPRCPRSITPLTSSQSRLNAEISALTADGNTYIPAGLVWGWRVLSPQAPFTEGATSVPGTNQEITKHLLLMTDGINTLHKPSGQPGHVVSATTDEANALTSALCENIKNAGISIYTVAFQVSHTATEQMLRNCASGPTNYYDADNVPLLISAFEAIADKIAVIRLSK